MHVKSMSTLFRLAFSALLCIAGNLNGAAARAEESVEQGATDFGFIGLHGGVFTELEKHAHPLHLRLKYFNDAEIAEKSCDLATVDVLFLQHIREEDRDAYRELLTDAQKRKPSLKIIPFQESSAPFLQQLDPNLKIEDGSGPVQYYGSTSENLRRLLIYAAATYLGRDLNIEPPEETQLAGFYHPDHEGMIETAAELETWLASRADKQPAAAPRIAVAVHSAHLTFQQPQVVDALIREGEKQGAVTIAIVDGGNPDYEKELTAFKPDAMIHTCHSSEPASLRAKLDVPHLHSIFIRKQSIDDWRKSVDGLSSSEMAFHIIGQELLGAIEPHVAAGTKSASGGAEAFEPIPEQVDRLIARTRSFAALRHTPQKEKRIAVIYYDREMGKGELMRGSATGMHMNAPRSLVSVLHRMRDDGYSMKSVPENEKELLEALIDRGRLIGVWAPQELDRVVRHGSPVLVPSDVYAKWYEERVPEDRKKQMEEKWGPPPGKFMVWKDPQANKEYIVIPRIDLGNVILLPQPLRGELHGVDANNQAHDKATTPPHNYIATYFWLENEFKANALVHFGTHGSEFALPGKPNGLSQRDWCNIIMGTMPNFNPWIIENMVESSPVRRRVYGTLISHLPPPIVDAGLSDDLANLHESVDKWSMLEDGALKEKFREEITRQTVQSRLDHDLSLQVPDDGKLAPADIVKVSDYLHDLQEEVIPTSLHVFGEPPRDDLLVPYMVTILRAPFLEALENLLKTGEHDSHEVEHSVRPQAEQILTLLLRENASPEQAVNFVAGRDVGPLPETIDKGLKLAKSLHRDFADTGNEINNLMKGLKGGFVPPGSGNSPIRNPNAVPTGRNMYLLNPEEVPTRPSWELGKKLAEELIARHEKEHGEFPTKIGFDLRSSATFRDYGVMEAQILYLMGVEPVWDDRQLVNDVRLIPREELGRPRIDVFIAAGSWYESNLPSRLNLWDKAVQLVAAADEDDNPMFKNRQLIEKSLVDAGVAPERAALLSSGRIFGLAPGRENGGFLGYKVARSGDWDDRTDIAKEYLASHKHVYTKGAWGEKAPELYDAAIQGTHTVVRSWSDHMTGPLASKYMWLHGGSLSLAVEQMTGKRPDYVFSDVRDPDDAGMIDAEDALQQEYRVRLFNRKWLEGMMKEGYAGADVMRVMVSNSFGWEVMHPGSVGDENWQQMKEVLVDDSRHLNLKPWFEQNNPFAYQDSLAVMLSAVEKGYWNADASTVQQLAAEYASSVARHGMSGHMTSGGNQKLDTLVRKQLAEFTDPKMTDVMIRYVERVKSQVVPTSLDAAPAVAASGPPQPAPVASPPPAESANANATNATTPSQVVTGQKLESVPQPPTKENDASEQPKGNAQVANHTSKIVLAAAALVAIVFLSGFMRQRRF